MATDPLELNEELETTVQRVRKDIATAGDNRAPDSGEFTSALHHEEREALMALLRDGTYRRTVAHVARRDPDLADQ